MNLIKAKSFLKNQKIKNSEAHKGKEPWNKGKKGVSDKTSKKMRLSALKRKK